MLAYTFFAPAVLTLTIGGYLLKTSNHDRIYLWEYLVLFLPIIFWNYLLMRNIGSQSLSNTTEVYILVLLICSYSFFRKKTVFSFNFKIIGTFLVLLLPFAIRLFFPDINE